MRACTARMLHHLGGGLGWAFMGPSGLTRLVVWCGLGSLMFFFFPPHLVVCFRPDCVHTERDERGQTYISVPCSVDLYTYIPPKVPCNPTENSRYVTGAIAENPYASLQDEDARKSAGSDTHHIPLKRSGKKEAEKEIQPILSRALKKKSKLARDRHPS